MIYSIDVTANMEYTRKKTIGCIIFPFRYVGLLNAGKLYRFATYNGSKLRELQILDDRVLLVFDRRNYTLKVEAFRTDGGELKSPVMGNMEGRINETLSARVNVSLTYKSEMLFCGTGTNAGLEVVGNLVL
ncbi:MAG: hypothetical protein R6U52_02915 [Kosmotogaceae bacterium]